MLRRPAPTRPRGAVAGSVRGRRDAPVHEPPARSCPRRPHPLAPRVRRAAPLPPACAAADRGSFEVPGGRRDDRLARRAGRRSHRPADPCRDAPGCLQGPPRPRRPYSPPVLLAGPFGHPLLLESLDAPARPVQQVVPEHPAGPRHPAGPKNPAGPALLSLELLVRREPVAPVLLRGDLDPRLHADRRSSRRPGVPAVGRPTSASGSPPTRPIELCGNPLAAFLCPDPPLGSRASLRPDDEGLGGRTGRSPARRPGRAARGPRLPASGCQRPSGHAWRPSWMAATRCP